MRVLKIGVGYVKHHNVKKKHVASSRYRKKEILRNPKSKRPLKRLMIPLVPTWTLRISMNIYGRTLSIYLRSQTLLSSFTHWPAVSATTWLPLKLAYGCFLLESVINTAPIRSTLFGYKTIFLLPLDKHPNIQLQITCMLQSYNPKVQHLLHHVQILLKGQKTLKQKGCSPEDKEEM